MLLKQNMETIKSFIDLIISDAKKEADILKRENNELKRLQFTQAEVDDLKTTIKNQNKEINTIQQNAAKSKVLEEREYE